MMLGERARSVGISAVAWGFLRGGGKDQGKEDRDRAEH